MIQGSDGRRRAARVGRALLALLVAAAALAAGFALGAALERPLASLDRAILLALRDPDDPARPLGPPGLAIAIRDVTALGGHTLVVAVAGVVAAWLAIAGRWLRAGIVVGTVAGAIALGAALKLGIGRPRPELVPHLVDVRSLSFPSSHAFLAAVVYPTVGAMLAGAVDSRAARVFVLAVAILIAVAVGLTRLYLGVHWPTDVLAGWLLGGAWALLCWHATRDWHARR